jgi:adenylate kinase family enzyme
VVAQVLLIAGPAGAGKTTLARRVAGRLGWPCISEDDHWVRNGWGTGLRSVDQERVVQAQVAAEALSASRDGTGVVLELILYKAPPNPLTAYQQILTDNGLTCTTVVLELTVDEILERLQRRGRPNDLVALDARRADAHHQLGVLASVDPASRVDATGMTVDELCAECVARLAPSASLEG